MAARYPNNIFLTGFMGVGKSTVGPLVSKILDWEYIDTDQLIEESAEVTVAEFFATFGEAAFRELETKMLKELTEEKGRVISLGGGALTQKSNQKLVSEAGVLVYLKASVATLVDRIEIKDRPLLAGLSGVELIAKIEGLLGHREPVYSLAHLTVHTDNKTPDEVAKAVVGSMKEWGRVVETVTLKLSPAATGLEPRHCPIYIGDGLLAKAGELTADLKTDRAFIIADRKLIAPAKKLASVLKSRMAVHQITLPATEKTKDYRRVFPIYAKMLEAGLDRHSVVFAVGGGVIGDLTGYVAGTYLRGIRWVGVPTTLLAQVDSSVGGKTGVNHPLGKNLIGVFHQPSVVICDTSLLKTLPERDRISGLGEIVKYGIAFDPEFFHYLNKHWEKVVALDKEVIRTAVAKSLSWKSRIVEEDELERLGKRFQLNFGHTLAHAFEGATGYRKFRHGEAVILGMRVAVALSCIRGHLNPSDAEPIEALLQKLEVPKVPALSLRKIMSYLKRDKKAKGGKVSFVLLKGLGETVPDNGVSEADVTEALMSLPLPFKLP